MSVSIQGANLVIAASGFLICLLCLTQAYLDQQMERTSRRILVMLFTVLAGYVLFNIAGQIVDDFHGFGFSINSFI